MVRLKGCAEASILKALQLRKNKIKKKKVFNIHEAKISLWDSPLGQADFCISILFLIQGDGECFQVLDNPLIE